MVGDELGILLWIAATTLDILCSPAGDSHGHLGKDLVLLTNLADPTHNILDSIINIKLK